MTPAQQEPRLDDLFEPVAPARPRRPSRTRTAAPTPLSTPAAAPAPRPAPAARPAARTTRDGTVLGSMAGVVNPDLERSVSEMLGALRQQGYDVRIGETRRTPERQRQHVAAGRSWTQNSRHLDGNAVDLIVYGPNGRPDWNTRNPAWRAIGAEAERRGLGWGGSYNDFGHVELPRTRNTAQVTPAQASLDDLFEPVTASPKTMEPEPDALADLMESAPAADLSDLFEPAEEEAGDVVEVNIGGARPRPEEIEFQPDTPDRMRQRMPILTQAARGAVALANDAPRLPDSHPDLLSAPLELRFPGRTRPSERQIAEAFLNRLGPEWARFGQDYFRQTGRLLVQPRNATPRRDRRQGAWVVDVQIPQGELDTLNAFASMGTEGAAAAQERIQGARQQSTDAARAAEQERAGQGFVANQVAGARHGVADLGLRSARLLDNLTGGGSREELNAAEQFLSKQPQSATRVALNLVGEGSRAALGPYGYAGLSVAQEAHRGQGAALQSGATGAVLGGGLAMAGRGVRALRNRGRVDNSPIVQPSQLGLNTARPAAAPAARVPPGDAGDWARELNARLHGPAAPARPAQAAAPVVAEVVEGIPVRPVRPRGRVGRAITNAAAAVDNTVDGVARSPVGTAARGVADVASFFRSNVASTDLSYTLRQGLIVGLRHPVLAARAFRRQVSALRSGRGYQEAQRYLATHPEVDAARQSGLYLGSLTGTGEEMFASRAANALWHVRRSSEASSAFIDTLRMDAFSRFAGLARQRGGDASAELQSYARFLNRATGRGDFDFLSRAARRVTRRDMPEVERVLSETLALPIFSPRLAISRFQILNVANYARMTPLARREAIGTMASFAGVVGTTLFLARAAGAEVGTDFRDSGFLKIRIGNMRIDTLAGLQQPLRFIFRMADASARQARGERLQPYETPERIAYRFARSKLSPVGSYAEDWRTGETFTGQEFEPVGHLRDERGRFLPGGGLVDRMLPFMVQDTLEAFQEHGLLGAAVAAPASALGVSVSTYDAQAERARRSARRRANRAPERGRDEDLGYRGR